MAQRRNDLDALRSFAMFLGVLLHASLSFVTFPWIVHDTQRSDPLFMFWVIVHGFRMPLFFLLSGYFTMLVFKRRGLKSLLQQRFKRIFVPLIVAALLIGALDGVIARVSQKVMLPEPAVAEILGSDLEAVSSRLAVAGSDMQSDKFWGRSLLTWSVMHGDRAIAEAVLDAVGNSKEQSARIREESLLHVATYFGNDEVLELLLKRGADPLDRNPAGNTASVALNLSADTVSELSPYLGLNRREVDEVLIARARIQEQIGWQTDSEGTWNGWLNQLAHASSRLQSSERLRIRLGGGSVHLIQTDLFDHLWFLWFLCWLVVFFAILARFGFLPSGRSRGWFMVATCLPQSLMFMAMVSTFGPDTSMGIIPKPHVLAYYACFFFYGVAEFAANDIDTKMGRSWKWLLPAAIIVFIVAIATINNRMLAMVLQPAYAWTMSLGLIGMFGRIFSRPHPTATWLADGSYWMYLIHLPLVLLAQLLVLPWAVPVELKFFAVLVIVIPLLLVSYRFGVRYTVIGRWLNGSRSMAE